jgi:hypothetical protein
MKNALLIKDIYLEAFRDLGHYLVKSYFKAFSWFCFASFAIMHYAFVFRISKGFAID